MESSTLKPDRIIQIFDTKKESKKGTLWDELIPKNIFVTPDGKGLIMTKKGKVECFLFDDPSHANIIIEHPKAKKCFPMVAVSQKKDGLLTIISASNYKNENNECVAEYRCFCDEKFNVKKLDRPIQAVSLDLYGTLLAIAHKRSIVVIDLESNVSNEQSFKGLGTTDHCVIDVAINLTGTSLIAAGSNGGIQLMSLSKKNGLITLSNTKEVIIRDNIIKKVYYPNCEELLYITEDGSVKTINILDGLLSPNNENANITDFAKSPYYDQVVADRYDAATMHWNMKDKGNTIEVYRKRNNKIEEFILEIPLLEEPYCYITDCGQYALSKGHILNTASAAGKYFVALATDGSIRIWNLPGDNIIQTFFDNDKRDEKLDAEHITSIKEAKKAKPKRGRSAESDKINKHSLISSDGEPGDKKKPSPRSEKDKLTSSDGEPGEKKKVSPRVFEVFKSSSGSLIQRDTSPQRGGPIDKK